MGDEVGEKTVTDLNQYVHSWIDSGSREVRELLLVLAGHRIRLKGDFTIEIEKREEKQP